MKIERGYLNFRDRERRLQAPYIKTPSRFQPPVRLGNWEYFRVPESQGNQPWCAAFAQCSILQAGAWRSFGFPKDYSEKDLYAEAKLLDGDTLEGTSLDSVIFASEIVFGIKSTTQVLEEAKDIPWAVHQYGAVLVGLKIDEGWQNPRPVDGLVTPSGANLGGHALVVSWYDLEKGRVGGPNWWTTGWGMSGYWSMTLPDFEKQFVYGYVQTLKFPVEN